MVLGQALPPALVGIAAGAAVAAAGRSLASTLLFGVRPNDAATYVAVGGIVIGVSCMAAALPAWRAARGELMRLLRHE
jgi:ABC-type antimicrobial peptide transport system permease subunit